MSVRLDRPPIALFNRFACLELEEDDKIRYSVDELLRIRETVPKVDLKMKEMVEAIIGKDMRPHRADRKFRPEQRSSQDVRVNQAAKQKFPSRSKDPAFRHFHTKRVWMPKIPAKK